MAHDLFSFDSSVLLVRDIAGDYRPADAGEVLQAAQRLLGQQLQGRDHLIVARSEMLSFAERGLLCRKGPSGPSIFLSSCALRAWSGSPGDWLKPIPAALAWRPRYRRTASGCSASAWCQCPLRALVYLQLGMPAARRGARRAAVGSSLPWPLAGYPSFPSFIADPATAAAGACQVAARASRTGLIDRIRMKGRARECSVAAVYHRSHRGGSRRAAALCAGKQVGASAPVAVQRRTPSVS